MAGPPADLAAWGGKDLPSQEQDLQSIALSPRVRVTVQRAATPDLAGLMAFARSQGISEAVLQLLEGETTLQSTPADQNPVLDDSILASKEGTESLTNMAYVATGQTPLLPPGAGSPRKAEAQPGESTPSGLGLITPAASATTVQPDTPATSTAPALRPMRQAPQPVPGSDMQNLMPAARPLEDGGSSLPVVRGFAWATFPASLPIAANGPVRTPYPQLEPVQVDATHATLPAARPDLAIAGAAPTRPVVAQPAVAGAPGASTDMPIAPAFALTRLSLKPDIRSDADPGEGNLMDTGVAPAPSPGPSGLTSPSSGVQPDSALAGTTIDEPMKQAILRHQEHSQQLGMRLAEILGHRLAVLIGQGNWQMNLQLNPAHLGRIEVRLAMSASREVEAEFLASQSQTRDLLIAGEARLRDTLDQAGLQLGRLQVELDNGQGRHPGQERGAWQKQANPPERQSSLASRQEPAIDAPAYTVMLVSERLDVLV